MRLSCPNCGAQYEVPVEVIPQDGRDVQCSNCGHTWFQMHPDQDAELASEVGGSLPDEGWDPNVDAAEDPAAEESTREVQPPEPDFDVPSDDEDAFEDAPEPEPVPEPEEEYVAPEVFDESDLEDDLAPEPEPEVAPGTAFDDDLEPEEEDEEDDLPAADPKPRRPIDAAIAEVLRGEAEYEAKAREEETLETQTELGLQEPEPQSEKRADEARKRMRRIRGLSEESDAPSTDLDPSTEAALEEAAQASRRELLPDIDEINSTLRSADERGATEGVVAALAAHRRARSGFRLGFGFVMLFAALVIMAYVYNKEIIAAYPASEPYVVGFMETMNSTRVWLDTRITEAMLWLDNIAESAGGNVE